MLPFLVDGWAMGIGRTWSQPVSLAGQGDEGKGTGCARGLVIRKSFCFTSSVLITELGSYSRL
jgi:hypothetical protein